MLKRTFTLSVMGILLFGITAFGQRKQYTINASWAFKKVGESLFQPINLPHTYNTQDAFDDEPGYYRGEVMYRKVLNTAALKREHRQFIRFHAANQNAELWVNGKKVGSHKGGYTAFTMEIGPYLRFGNDTLTLIVDNSHDESVPPLRGDFTFYGGIYRDVELIEVPPTHFNTNFYGTDALFIDPLKVNSDSALLRVWGQVENFDPGQHQIEVTLEDETGELLDKSLLDLSKQDFPNWEMIMQIPNPHLWSMEDPYLYRLSCQLIEKTSKRVLDKMAIPYGIRFFEFDADQGFFLNGKHQKLIGVNRHQDRPGIGNALTTAQHVEDMKLIEEMGTNFLRTAHYPQDRAILDFCDQKGIVVSMEIPLDHEISPGKEFAEISKLMTLEMIYQYYNHPSIIIWAYMNEMGLGMQIKRDSLIMTQVASLARELENLVRKNDPYRYTMIPNHGDFGVYHHFGLTQIPMIVGWNLYYGWYEADLGGLAKFVDHAHSEVPDKPILITEYGAGADPRITSFNPLRFDFSMDWALRLHQANLRQILDRPFVAGSAVWNMFDFGSESRNDAVPHVNNKGLCGFDRQKKPVFYLYQSYLTEEPVSVVEKLPSYFIVSKSTNRSIPISIISNKDSVMLSDGEQSMVKKVSDQVASFDWPIRRGKQSLLLENKEAGTLNVFTWEDYWEKNNVFRLNLGANFFFQPSDQTSMWYPSDEMPAEALRVPEGENYMPRSRGIGSDRPIALSEEDPVYQTSMVNLKNLNLQLPRGKYKIILHLARLNDDQDKQVIRVHDQVLQIPALPLRQAYSISCEVQIDRQLLIDWLSGEETTFLNGIEVVKLSR